VPFPARKGKGCARSILLLFAALLVSGAWGAGAVFSHLSKVEPAAEASFRWPYFLYTPDWLEDNRIFGTPIRLLVVPNNSGFVSDDQAFHERMALATAIPYPIIFGDLDVAILVPTFPRPSTGWECYTHALDRDTLLADSPDLRRIDLQLEAMIDDAADRLSRRGWTVDRKILMMGFSASAMFVNRFAVLHPDRVLGAAIGSPGGWPIAPVREWQGRSLRYPVGVADLEALTGESFDLDSFRQVPLFFFLGDRDENDSVTFPDSYDDEDRALMIPLFGATPVERWDDADAIYASIGARAEFHLYPGVGHTMTMKEFLDLRDFFTMVLAEEGA